MTSRTDPDTNQATPATTAGPARSRARAAWPARRLVAAAVLTPALTAALVAVGGGGWTAAPGWLALVIAIAAACSVTLASYVPRPGAGRRLDVGCTPCASVAALSVIIAAGVLSSDPYDVPTAILALAAAAFGVWKRLTDPSTCPI